MVGSMFPRSKPDWASIGHAIQTIHSTQKICFYVPVPDSTADQYIPDLVPWGSRDAMVAQGNLIPGGFIVNGYKVMVDKCTFLRWKHLLLHPYQLPGQKYSGLNKATSLTNHQLVGKCQGKV